ncbi:MAG: Gfo/Idh/MocA family oxidoreductase [Abditibacteriaceae bacterium]
MQPVKVGIIGVGGMGHGHVAALTGLKEADLVAVSDVNEETVNAVAQETGAKPFTSYEALITEGGVESIVIATPHYFHPPIAEFAASNGVHVFTEKPIAVTAKVGSHMVQACKDNGVMLGVNFQTRLDVTRAKMHSLIASGAIGEIMHISMEVPWYRTQAYYNSGGWRGTWKGEGGGVLMNQSPHNFDQLNWLMGEMPKSVQSIVLTRLHQIEVDNTALAIFDYGTGKVGSVYVSTAEALTTERIEISGDLGALRYEGGKLSHYKLEESLAKHLRETPINTGIKGEWSDVEVTGESGSTAEMHLAFLQAVRENDSSKIVATGEDGMRSLEIANAILMAGYTRREVSFPLDYNAVQEMFDKLCAGDSPESLRTN